MRQRYANVAVIAVAVLLAAFALGFAVLAAPGAGDGRTAEVAELQGDPDAGAAWYAERTQPTCASCHSLAAAGAESAVASDLDVMRPDERRVIASIVEPGIGAHDAQDYRDVLSNRAVADLAAYVAAVAGEGG